MYCSAKDLRFGVGLNISLEFEQLGAVLIHPEISEIADPVTEVDVNPFFAQWHANGQMPVAEEVEITLLFFVLFQTILKEPLVFCSVEFRILSARVFPTVTTAAVGQPDPKIGMKSFKAPLKQAVGEDLFQQFVSIVSRTQSVSMSDEHRFAIQLELDGVPVQTTADLFGQVIEDPKVVVASE